MTPQSASTAFTSRQSIARQVRQSAAKTPSHPSDATTPRVVHTTRAVKLFHRSARERHVHFMDIRCRPDLVEMERGAARGPVHSRGNCASFGMQMQVVPQARKLVRGGQKEEALPNPCGPSGGPEGEMEALGRYLGHCGARGCRGRTRLPVHDVHGPPASRKAERLMIVATGPALRDGWVAVPHPEGGVYYWNTSTNQTSLEPVLAIEVPTPEPVVLVERWSSQPGPAQVPARHVLAGFFCSLGFSSANDPELHEERQTGLASRHAGKSYKTHLDTPLEELL
eukprot:s2675_g2.t4